MTEVPPGFIVTLADGIAEDEVAAVVAAIGLLRNVVSVQPVDGDPTLQVARARADAEWRQRIVDLLDDEGV